MLINTRRIKLCHDTQSPSRDARGSRAADPPIRTQAARGGDEPGTLHLRQEVNSQGKSICEVEIRVPDKGQCTRDAEDKIGQIEEWTPQLHSPNTCGQSVVPARVRALHQFLSPEQSAQNENPELSLLEGQVWSTAPNSFQFIVSASGHKKQMWGTKNQTLKTSKVLSHVILPDLNKNLQITRKK